MKNKKNINIKERTDEQLMQQFIRTLREKPFDELVSRYIGKGVEYAAAILRNRADAEDAVQETFLRIIRARKTYKPGKRFAPWFYTILKHICFDIHAARKKERSALRKQEHIPSEEAASALPAGKEILEMVSESDRHILHMKILNGFSVHEIARVLDCSYEAAKKRCQRALAKLREKVNSEDTKTEGKTGLTKQSDI